MDVGDKAIIKRKICANNLENPHYNKVATIDEIGGISQVRVSIDDFPECNHRSYHNKFWYSTDELNQHQ